MRLVYMDYGSASPVDSRVLEAMIPYFDKDVGNPSSLHSSGRKAKRELEAARSKVANLIGAPNPKSIIFTSCATESNNLALRGAALRYKDKGNHIITTSIEHMSVMNPLKDLQRSGFEVTYIPVDKDGLVNAEQIKNAITEKTILISVMYANGEIGTVQPIREIGEIASDRKILFHVDGTSAVGKMPVNVEEEHIDINIDIMTFSSNDIYGTKGVGALYIKQGVRVMPFMLGGGQESGMRSGSLNIPGIVGMGKAAELAANEIFKKLGLGMDEKGYIKTDKSQKTNIDGIYAVGDIASDIRLVVVAVAHGETFAHNAYTELRTAKTLLGIKESFIITGRTW
ncbi:MAG: aminotransferase class V-fold PLP-dependent enzyme [Euryarchaeota archaeon]|nr:aminotransferase class V-fold PLP-dependent enzyme [Euryarchaeota archaeon]MCG2727470.1 aminotransferase class V-fold PLP-dependent enzyme [Candidatus Methanoperedenaceae archaeon]